MIQASQKNQIKKFKVNLDLIKIPNNYLRFRIFFVRPKIQRWGYLGIIPLLSSVYLVKQQEVKHLANSIPFTLRFQPVCLENQLPHSFPDNFISEATLSF